jgi:hypothetical protein
VLVLFEYLAEFHGSDPEGMVEHHRETGSDALEAAHMAGIVILNDLSALVEEF